MKWILIVYAIGWNNVTFIEDYPGFESQDQCLGFSNYLQHQIEKNGIINQAHKDGVRAG